MEGFDLPQDFVEDDPSHPLHDLQNLLACPICLELYTSTRKAGEVGGVAQMLSCGHSFCHQCMTKRNWSEHPKCPSCAQTATHLDLRQNHLVMALADAYRKLKNQWKDVVKSEPAGSSERPASQGAARKEKCASESPARGSQRISQRTNSKLSLSQKKKEKAADEMILVLSDSEDEGESGMKTTKGIPAPLGSQGSQRGRAENVAAAAPPSQSSFSAMKKVECPKCHVLTFLSKINEHLDNGCKLSPDYNPEVQAATKSRPKKITGIFYNSLLKNKKELDVKLKMYHLHTTGAVADKVQRLKTFVNKWNCEVEFDDPRPAKEVAEEVHKEERDRASAAHSSRQGGRSSSQNDSGAIMSKLVADVRQRGKGGRQAVADKAASVPGSQSSQRPSMSQPVSVGHWVVPSQDTELDSKQAFSQPTGKVTGLAASRIRSQGGSSRPGDAATTGVGVGTQTDVCVPESRDKRTHLPLPSNWRRMYSEVQGRYFYFNTSTGVGGWEHPDSERTVLQGRACVARAPQVRTRNVASQTSVLLAAQTDVKRGVESDDEGSRGPMPMSQLDNIDLLRPKREKRVAQRLPATRITTERLFDNSKSAKTEENCPSSPEDVVVTWGRPSPMRKESSDFTKDGGDRSPSPLRSQELQNPVTPAEKKRRRSAKEPTFIAPTRKSARLNG